MPGGLASQARGVALRDRCRGCIEGRRVFRGGTVSMGRMVSLGVLACRHRRTVLSRVRGSLVRQFMGLMAQAIVARVCIPQLRLIVPMPGGLASQARGVALRDRCRGCIEGRGVFRGGTVSMGRMVSLGVLACRHRRTVLSRVRGSSGSAIHGTDGPSHCCPGLHSPTATYRSHARGARLASPGRRSSATVVAGVSKVERVFRGGTVSMGRMVSLGVLACRHRRTVLSRVQGSLVRQFMGLMAQAIVARVCIPQLRLIVHMPGGCASQGRGTSSSEKCPATAP